MPEERPEPPPALDYEAYAPRVRRPVSLRLVGILVAIALASGGFLALPFSHGDVPFILLALSALVFLATHVLAKLPDEFEDTFDPFVYQQRKREMLTVARHVYANGPIGSWKCRNLLDQPQGAPLKEERTVHLNSEGVGHFVRLLHSSPPQTQNITFRFQSAPAPSSGPSSDGEAESPPLAMLVHLTSPALVGWHKVVFGFYVHRPPRRDPQLLVYFDPAEKPPGLAPELWPFQGVFAQSSIG